MDETMESHMSDMNEKEAKLALISKQIREVESYLDGR